VHVASSIPGGKNVKDDVMMKTAEIGMHAILEAAVAYKVKKIVITSSFSTIGAGLWKKD
jgi:nucleoside-diphosphate-sugar epimerase